MKIELASKALIVSQGYYLALKSLKQRGFVIEGKEKK